MLAGVLGALALPSAAQATSCSGGGVTYNRADIGVQFRDLRVYGGNCASGRYVLKFIRHKWAMTYANVVDRQFWDGYVYWRCYKGYRERCYERTSHTKVTFIAELV